MVDINVRIGDTRHGLVVAVFASDGQTLELPAQYRARLSAWARRNNVRLHTVVFTSGLPGPFDEVWFYRRGVTAVTSLAEMLPVRDGVHLRALLQLPPRELAREMERLVGAVAHG